MEITPEFRSRLITMAKQNKEPDWFIKQRLQALQQVTQLNKPVIQRFKYQNWDLTPLTEFIPLTTAGAFSTDNASPSASNPRLIQFESTTIRVTLPTELLSQGVIVCDLMTALQQHGDLVAKYWGQALKDNSDQLTKYNEALVNHGIFIYVPEGVNSKQVLQLELKSNSKHEQQPFISRVLIVTQANSRLNIMQHQVTSGTQVNLANCVVEVVAAENSRVEFTALDEMAAQTLTYLQRQAVVGPNARVNWSIGLFNDGDTVANFNTNLMGQGSSSEAKVVAISAQKQRLGINTGMTNLGQHTEGQIAQRGILLDASELVFNGIGHIIHGASGAKSEQENRVLMMSNQAHGNANPMLLIDENDVVAGHAASVGQVDQQQLYYLMSRGIDEETAKRMVIRGFLGTILSELDNKSVRKQFSEAIERKLTNGY